MSLKTGLIQHIDASNMNKLAEEKGVRIFIDAMPGALVHPTRLLFYLGGDLDERSIDELRECISIGEVREYEQDPRFGLIVLSEIASRALSPAVNDPGAAIEVLASGLRVLLSFADAHDKMDQPRFCSVHAPEMDIPELFASFFNPISRDGTNVVEVQMRLIKTLEALALRKPDIYRGAAVEIARQALERCTSSNMAPHEKAEIIRRAKMMSAQISNV